MGNEDYGEVPTLDRDWDDPTTIDISDIIGV